MRDQNDILSTALAAVAAACRVARRVQRDGQGVSRLTKDDKSPVTVADYAVQSIVASHLFETLGPALIVGEEHAGALRSPEHSTLCDAVVQAVREVRPGMSTEQVLAAIDQGDHDGSAPSYWTLDPVDGTKGFLRGQQYAIALARIEHGRVVLGVMGCPNLSADPAAALDRPDPIGTMYYAVQGGGAFELSDDSCVQPRRIRALPFNPAGGVRACESVEASHSSQDDTARILREIGKAGPPARLDSQCKYAVVARGQADAYLRLPTGRSYVEKIWDHAAGMLIAQEAGATVSDITGASLDFSHGRRLEANRGVICAVPGLHDRLIEAIDRLGIGAAA